MYLLLCFASTADMGTDPGTNSIIPVFGPVAKTRYDWCGRRKEIMKRRGGGWGGGGHTLNASVAGPLTKHHPLDHKSHYPNLNNSRWPTPPFFVCQKWFKTQLAYPVLSYLINRSTSPPSREVGPISQDAVCLLAAGRHRGSRATGV